MAYHTRRANLTGGNLELLRLFRENLPRPDDAPGRISWLYGEQALERAICCLALDGNGDRAIGTTAVFPRRMRAAGRDCKAGICGDFAVAAAHRTAGLALQLQRAILSECGTEGVDLLYGFPNQNALPVMLRAGFCAVSDVKHLIMPLRPRYVLPRYLPSLLAIPLAAACDIGLRVAMAATRRRRNRRFEFELLNRFDERFDDLWARASRTHLIIGERSAKFLNWRFVASPHGQYTVLAAIDRSSRELRAYTVYSRDENRVMVADLLAEAPGALHELMSEFVVRQYQAGAQCVSMRYVGGRELIRSLSLHGFLARDSGQKFIAYPLPQSPQACLALQPRDWYVTDADSDL